MTNKPEESIDMERSATNAAGLYDEKLPARTVLSKIDWRLMPLIIGSITISAVDKVLISNVALYGMSTDTRLVGQDYSWGKYSINSVERRRLSFPVGLIFHFGWLAAEYTGNIALQNFPVGKTVATCVTGWGNAVGLIVLRFLMDALKAPLFPVVTILNSMWYKKEEQPLRIAVAFMGFSNLVTGIVLYGIGNLQRAIASWRLLFLVVGGFTVDFLGGKDKFIALDRVRENMTGVENRGPRNSSCMYQVREAFTDYMTYLLFFFYLCMNVPTGGLVTFADQIVSGLGYGKLETTLLGMPTGMVQSLAGFMVAIPQRWLRNERCLSSALSAAWYSLLAPDNKVGRLLACYFFRFFLGPYATGMYAVNKQTDAHHLTAPRVLSLVTANVSGHTKKPTVSATVFLAYCTANIIGPQVFIATEALHYTTGYNAIQGFEVAAIVCLAAYGIGCALEDKRREVAEQLGDLTDYEKEGFRYVY
ncbi:MFS general substrate transporter [Colletotrichum falcatum]|nr:MFS general substrate transporter [Colletotrichum falcatum]